MVASHINMLRNMKGILCAPTLNPKSQRRFQTPGSLNHFCSRLFFIALGFESARTKITNNYSNPFLLAANIGTKVGVGFEDAQEASLLGLVEGLTCAHAETKKLSVDRGRKSAAIPLARMILLKVCRPSRHGDLGRSYPFKLRSHSSGSRQGASTKTVVQVVMVVVAVALEAVVGRRHRSSTSSSTRKVAMQAQAPVPVQVVMLERQKYQQ